MRASQRRHQEHGRAHTGHGLPDLLPWAPTLLGVVALFVLLIVAATRFTSSPAPAALPPAPTFLPPPVLAPAQLPPDPDAVPAGPGSSAAAASTSASARPSKQSLPARTTTTPRPAPSSSRPTTTAPAPTVGPVTGRYRVLDSYPESFIGEVLIANSAGRDSAWRVELRFPAAVGDLVTAWVEGAPQATLRRSGDTYIWSSGAPVPAGSQVPLRFHFSRSGSGNLPTACTVNGGSCAGVR